jgi:hypothetical protein
MPWKKAKGGGKTTKRGGFVKNTKQYEALRKKGVSKGKAARIANSKKR